MRRFNIGNVNEVPDDYQVYALSFVPKFNELKDDYRGECNKLAENMIDILWDEANVTEYMDLAHSVLILDDKISVITPIAPCQVVFLLTTTFRFVNELKNRILNDFDIEAVSITSLPVGGDLNAVRFSYESKKPVIDSQVQTQAEGA